jgi:hypothetical protein
VSEVARWGVLYELLCGVLARRFVALFWQTGHSVYWQSISCVIGHTTGLNLPFYSFSYLIWIIVSLLPFLTLYQRAKNSDFFILEVLKAIIKTRKAVDRAAGAADLCPEAIPFDNLDRRFVVMISNHRTPSLEVGLNLVTAQHTVTYLTVSSFLELDAMADRYVPCPQELLHAGLLDREIYNRLQHALHIYRRTRSRLELSAVYSTGLLWAVA